jgi:hypothetical protein
MDEGVLYLEDLSICYLAGSGAPLILLHGADKSVGAALGKIYWSVGNLYCI